MQPEGWQDAPVQEALRGWPRNGEDWESQTLVEVLISRAHAAGFRATTSEPDTELRQALVVSDVGATVFVSASVHPSQVRRWAEVDSFERAEGVDVMDFQKDLLDEVIHSLHARGDGPSEVVATLAAPIQGWWPWGARADAALRLWWEARRDEGHTRESAKVMLGLLVHPSLFSSVVFDLAGDPYMWFGSMR